MNNLPDFTAEAVFYKRQASNAVVPALLSRDSDTPTDRRVDCLIDCVESGQSQAVCQRRCSPPPSPPYQCRPTDNSFNYIACQGGVAAWEAACGAACRVFLPEGLCSEGCKALADNFRSTCPPKTICI
jgi:hypothetical protein